MLLGRVDLPVVNAGCTTLKNAIPLKNGGVRRIPGTYYAGPGYASGTVNGRLIRFPAKSGQYIVELTNLKARIWNAAHTVVQYSAVDLVLTTTITTAELFECQARVVNNELFIVHHSHPVQRIKETTPAPFTLDVPTFTGSRTFGATGDYPSVVTAHRGSLVLGGSDNDPTGYAISRSPVAATGVFRTTDFTSGTNPDDAIIGFNTDGEGSRFTWIQAHRRVAAGMTKTVWADAGGLPTPANFYMQTVDYDGAATVQAAILKNAILYIGAPIPSLQMLIYSDEAGGMTDIDASRYFRHLLRPGIVQMAAMTSPEPGVWLVRTDGKIVAVCVDINGGALSVGAGLYEPADGGLVKSAEVLRGANGDELWMYVLRGSVYQVEWMVFPTDNDSDFTELHYIDSGIRWTGASTNTVSGLAHLNGKTVHAIADGASMPAAVVAAGVATYEKSFTKIHVGLPNESICTPTRPEVQANATWQGKKKNVEAAVLRISKSYGGKIASGANPTAGDYQTIAYAGGPYQEFGAAPSPVTEDIHLDVVGDVDTDGVVSVKQDEPFPMTLLAIITRIKIQEA